MENVQAKKYRTLISRFLDNELDVVAFELEFTQRFKNETQRLPDRIFVALDSLFSDIDAFCVEDELREKGDLNEAELRESCQRTVEVLLREL